MWKAINVTHNIVVDKAAPRDQGQLSAFHPAQLNHHRWREHIGGGYKNLH